MNEFERADAAVELEQPDSPAIPDTFTIGMVSSIDDRVAQRQHGASMAVEAINQAGGVPDGTGRKRMLALATATGSGAADSLRELETRSQLSAVIGPDSSGDMLELVRATTVDRQLLTIGPNNTVDSIVETVDSDLSWSLVPTDRQRMPLLMRALNALETKLQETRADHALRLSILYRDDPFGRGLRTAFEGTTWGGVGLVQPDSQARVRITPYDPHALNLSALVQEQVEFAPDVVVVVGMGEAVTQIIEPLEQLWRMDARPEYILTDAAKGPELLKLISARPELLGRAHGIGAAPTSVAEPHYQSFLRGYSARFAEESAQPSGVEAATAYDAVFVIAYALASAGTHSHSGVALSRGVRLLTGGALQLGTDDSQLAAAFTSLARGDAISARGTLSTFEWDSGGGIATGAAEIWCVVDATAPRYASTGLRYDIAARAFDSVPSECEPSAPGQATKPQPELSQPGGSGAAPTVTRSSMDAGAPDAGEPAEPELPPVASPFALSVHYQANDSVPDNSSIRPFIRVLNAFDGEYVPLRQLSLRYYLDNEHAASCPDSCVAEVSYAGTQPSGRALRASSRFVATSGNQGYLEVSFVGSGSAELAAGETLEAQLHFHTMPYLQFDETNDYSFDATARSYREAQRITAYVSNQRVWGVEPTL